MPEAPGDVPGTTEDELLETGNGTKLDAVAEIDVPGTTDVVFKPVTGDPGVLLLTPVK